MHPSAYNDAERFVSLYLRGSPLVIVDVGSRDVNGTLKPLFDDPGCTYTGVDIADGPNVDVVLKLPYHWPELKSDSADVVVSTQVMEHVRQPWRWIDEIVRITKPGGLVYVCSPNHWPYHEHPVDCWRVWPEGMRALLEYAGLEMLECYASNLPCDGHRDGETTGIARKPRK